MNKLFPEVGVAQIIKYSEELCGDKVLVEKTYKKYNRDIFVI